MAVVKQCCRRASRRPAAGQSRAQGRHPPGFTGELDGKLERLEAALGGDRSGGLSAGCAEAQRIWVLLPEHGLFPASAA